MYELDSDSDSTIMDVEINYSNTYKTFYDKGETTNNISSLLSGSNYKEYSKELELILQKYSDSSSDVYPKVTGQSSKVDDIPIELSSDEELPPVDQQCITSSSVKIDQDLHELPLCFAANNVESAASNETAQQNCDSSKKRKHQTNTDSDKDKQKQEKILQRAQKQEQLAKEKRMKQAIRSANRNLKPGECLKFVTVRIDEEILKENYGPEILNSLQSVEVTYNINTHLLPNLITWTREAVTQNIKDSEEFIENVETVEVNEALVIINWDEIVKLVSTETLISHMETIKSVINNKKIFIAIYGLENYFRYYKRQKKREKRCEISQTVTNTTDKHEKMFRDAAKIGRKQLEMAFTELQILHSYSYRLVDSPQDLGAMVVQFTKSIASAPYKLEKYSKQLQAEWFMAGDNKDCVKVDKNGNGLKRLWQQQLITFPLTRLEHAEAIIAKYPTMKSLIEEYNDLPQCQGEKVLQDVPIRRAAGPLTTVRRLGIELSKKVYKHFSAEDGDLIL